MEYLGDPPDPNSDLTMEWHLESFDGLCSAVLMLLASLASNREEIRYKVSSEGEMIRYLSTALSTDKMAVKVAAVRYVSDGRSMFRVRESTCTMYIVESTPQ